LERNQFENRQRRTQARKPHSSSLPELALPFHNVAIAKLLFEDGAALTPGRRNQLLAHACCKNLVKNLGIAGLLL